jgi:protein-serine/threonine kinase
MLTITSFVMSTNSIPWKSAVPSDPRYKFFLDHRFKYAPIDRLLPGPRQMLVILFHYIFDDIS